MSDTSSNEGFDISSKGLADTLDRIADEILGISRTYGSSGLEVDNRISDMLSDLYGVFSSEANNLRGDDDDNEDDDED